MADQKTYTREDLTLAEAALIRAKNHGHRYEAEAAHYRERMAHFQAKAEYCESRIPIQKADRAKKIKAAEAKIAEIKKALAG